MRAAAGPGGKRRDTEQDVADAMGYGPAGIGWPWVAAQNWIGKMRKLGQQLDIERENRIKAMREQDEKDQKLGEKMKQEREKMAALAEKMKAENKKMTKIQEDAWKLVNEGGALRVGELPSAYLKAKAEIELGGIGVCSKCRYSSGCMDCNVWKRTACWMRREGKRLGRKIHMQFAGKNEKSKQNDQND